MDVTALRLGGDRGVDILDEPSAERVARIERPGEGRGHRRGQRRGRRHRAEIGICANRGGAVSGQVNLRDDGDVAVGGLSLKLAELREAVRCAVRRVGQPRPAGNLYAPGLVVGQVQVEHVQLVKRGEVGQSA